VRSLAGVELIKGANLLVRLGVELAALAALCYWGFSSFTGDLSFIVGLGAPLLLALVWGMAISPRSLAPLPTRVNFFIGTGLLLLAALALGTTGEVGRAIAYGAVIVVNAALILAWGQ
jgi:hypothetical protein